MKGYYGWQNDFHDPEPPEQPVYDGLLVYGDNFNPDAVCPHYLPESQWTFTWYRNEHGIPVLSGYDPEDDLATDWLCVCGHYETGGCCCTHCGAEPPWGCVC